jgi:hypothetical protein
MKNKFYSPFTRVAIAQWVYLWAERPGFDSQSEQCFSLLHSVDVLDPPRFLYNVYHELFSKGYIMFGKIL